MRINRCATEPIRAARTRVAEGPRIRVVAGEALGVERRSAWDFQRKVTGGGSDLRLRVRAYMAETAGLLRFV